PRFCFLHGKGPPCHGFAQLAEPAGLVGSEEKHRRAAGGDLALCQRDETLARPALMRAAGAGRGAAVTRSRREQRRRLRPPRLAKGEIEDRRDVPSSGELEQGEEL